MKNPRTRLGIGIAAGLLALVLSGCAGGGGGSGYGYGSGSPNPSTTPEKTTTTSAALTTANSSLGSIIVDAKGMTVYVFDKDTANSGKSACEGQCLATWPAVVAASDTPKADGVTGTLGTITRTDNGAKQLTLNGLPLYHYASDTAPGDVRGQGVGGIWWVVGPDGAKMTTGAVSGY